MCVITRTQIVLTCDHVYCILKGFMPPTVIDGDTKTECLNKASKDGWALFLHSNKAYCPHCKLAEKARDDAEMKGTNS